MFYKIINYLNTYFPLLDVSLSEPYIPEASSVFLSSQAVISYAQRLESESPEGFTAFQAWLNSVKDGTYGSLRYENNPQLRKAFDYYPQLKIEWIKGETLLLDDLRIQELGKSARPNIRKFIQDTLTQNNPVFFQKTFPELISFLSASSHQEEELIHRNLKEKIDAYQYQDKESLSAEFFLTRISLKLINSLQSSKELFIHIALQESLKDWENYKKKAVPHISDAIDNTFLTMINKIFTASLQIEKEQPLWASSLFISDTDDPSLLLGLGRGDPANLLGVYQNGEQDNYLSVYYPETRYSKALLGVIMDGKYRLLAIHDAKHQIMAQRQLTLFLDTKTQQPALYLDQLYHYGEFYKKAIFDDALLAMALRRATAMKLPLYRIKESGELSSAKNDLVALARRGYSPSYEEYLPANGEFYLQEDIFIPKQMVMQINTSNTHDRKEERKTFPNNDEV